MKKRLEELKAQYAKNLADLNSLLEQRTNRNSYISANESHEQFDTSLEFLISFLRNNNKSIESSIKDLETLIAENVHSENIQVGSTFDFILDNGYANTATLVNESISANGKNLVSIHSELGKSVIGKKANDRFSYNCPAGLFSGTINKVYTLENPTIEPTGHSKIKK